MIFSGMEDAIHENGREQVRLLKHKEVRQAVVQGDVRTVKVLLDALGDERELVVNMSPSGANTLLFLASQFGYEEILQVLIEAGADGRSHTVTKYSPLYAAVHHGNYKITKLLLKTFPELIQEVTVERWLPLHAACINGHINIVELLLSFEYPEKLYTTYRDDERIWEWKLPFDPNQQDVTGQTSLYIASILGNKALVGVLLNWKVKSYKIKRDFSPQEPVVTTPTNKKISLGIQTLMSKLSLSEEDTEELTSEQCPININLLCGAARETALLAAVRGGFLDVVALLLQKGANPNVVARPVEDQNDPKCSEEIYGLCNTPVAEASKQTSLSMIDLLLKYGAKDDQETALSIAIANKDDVIMSRLLGRKAYPDLDFNINKKGFPLTNEKDILFPSGSNVTYSAIFPKVPTIINWHNKYVQLPFIRLNWIVNAVLVLNPKLCNHPRVDDLSLMAITRIDLSHNSLSTLPAEIFNLLSLKYLNVAQNKLEELPTLESNKKYNCPLLEEIYIQDNRLTSVPPELFMLPSLIILDISNNKLQDLPFELWKAPKLREFNVAFNLLRDLPAPAVQDKSIFHAKFCSKNEFGNVSKQHSCMVKFNLIHHNIWSYSLEITDNEMTLNDSNQDEEGSQLTSINLANNLFTSVPVSLPCLATKLTRLNLSYNSLRSMGHVTSYPATLKQLDLSHNEITCWPSLPQVSKSDPYLRCYAIFVDNVSPVASDSGKSSRNPMCSSFRSSVLRNVCRHRKHLRLESLRTLLLADNLLTRIQLSTDDITTFNESDDSDWSVIGISKSKLIFPNLSMLDISNNCLKEIPPALHELSSLSVLNISGNIDITDLPPHLGLLSRLWNLNTRGCLLQEPLKSMVENRKYKTMDIIGYLKSIYEDAQPYSRMKLMVVGVQGIGKTTLLELLRNGGMSRGKSSIDHWAKRMGHKDSYSKTNKGANISTVGVDIGTWICDRRKKNTSSNGPVIFRTWDFGGQKEYYATHQYFLSKRSLYLVLWKITDGHKGLSEILQWLGNIQARAPNSPVIIVGTHYDAINDNFSPEKSEELQQIIRERFIAIPDAEKVGLPKVIDSIEISCRTFHNIRLLSNIIYDTAFTIKSAGSKEPLLLQKIPASYVALEDVISSIVYKLKLSDIDPVLDAENYRKLVNEEMHLHSYKGFRDSAELNQATMFLHDNGIILHYDDATLRDFYFLDPQWLCDMLAHVVTVREINPFARNGIMKVEDLQLLFKNVKNDGQKNRSYIINLLNKFEVALTWDTRTLLIPSLLPEEEGLDASKAVTIRASHKLNSRSSTPYKTNNLLIFDKTNIEEIKKSPIRRVLLMTYFPSGFWSRLITRLLADEQILKAIQNIYSISQNGSSNLEFMTLIEQQTNWNLWQTGLALYVGNTLVLKIWEIPFIESSIYRNYSNKFKLKIDGIWNDINILESSLLEILLPLHSISIVRFCETKRDGERTILEPNYSTISQLLALCVDHIDLLLEDWYPSLGTRFVHTSEGRFLITRLVFCPKCLKDLSDTEPTIGDVNHRHFATRGGGGGGGSGPSSSEALLFRPRRGRRSEDSLYMSDADSGVEPDSASSSRNTSVDGHPLYNMQLNPSLCYTWMIEECILSVYNRSKLLCPLHSTLDMIEIAPDVVFADIPTKYTVNSESVVKGALLGRGAFGFVFKATCRVAASLDLIEVAMKMLQPVPPGPRAKESAVLAYKVAVGKWDRDPLQHCCKAYCTARQELAVLLTLQHANIVPLIGICIEPLALVLELAPMGALDSILRQYRRSGARIGPHTFQAMALQVARAVEYLHRKRIIYRDLKSENILVWKFPLPHTADRPIRSVHIKIADYGISRITAPSGSKGFGGTEGFMAPEIIRYNGEEEYTEKVDCFSFGMFLYEIITLRQPFEGHESIKECILEGRRPLISHRETNFPTYCLDLMVLCWDELPKRRPSASQIVSILSAPEVIHLLDAVVLPHNHNVICGSFYQQNISEDDVQKCELLLPCFNARIDCIESTLHSWTQYRSITSHKFDLVKTMELQDTKFDFLCSCIVEDTIWMGDSFGTLHSFRISDKSHVFSYILDSSVLISVVFIIYLKHFDRVAVGLDNGRIFLVDSKSIPSNYAFLEGSFVLTEFSCDEFVCCACVVWYDDTYELWCGSRNADINIFSIKDSVASGHRCVTHNRVELENVITSNLYSSKNFVYSSLSPGHTIYQWDMLEKTVSNKLDCSKLLPCSESLKSMPIEEHLQPSKCRISTLAVHNSYLYVGTTWGCLVIADAISLHPITVFRPYKSAIGAIIPVVIEEIPLIATIGRRYRSLMNRFIDSDDGKTRLSQQQQFDNDAVNKKIFKESANNIHCLLWRSQDWT